jgi:hypothetical protein
MTHSSPRLQDRIRNSLEHWVQNRMQECVHCTGCDSVIFPLASYCPKCGQANPTQVSTSAVVCLVLGFVFLASTLAILTTIF